MQSLFRLCKLRAMIQASYNAYYKAVDSGRMPSDRILGWIDEYNDYRTQQPMMWKSYCDARGSDLSHDAYDLLA